MNGVVGRGLLGFATMPVLLAMVLVGCAPATGAVEVEVAVTAPAAGYSVQIMDARGRTVGRVHLERGRSQGFEHVPLGKVTVTALGLCSVSTAVTAGSTVRAIFGDKHCTLA